MKKKLLNPKVPNNNLSFLPPEKFITTNPIFRQLIKTHKILAELKGYSELLPNKNIILHSITLQEAKDSSEIENIITTHDELYKAIATKGNDKTAVKEVLNYKKALFKGMELIKARGFLSTNIIVEIQQEIEGNDAGIRKLPGTTLMNDKTGEIMYTPPDNENFIRNCLKNLEEFINTDDERLDPLVKLAMIHYQFEAIHPFYDGNGRTGRIMNVLYLVLTNLLSAPFLYLSSYIIQNKSDYYRLLRSVTTDEAWEEWILYILKAVEKTAEKTLSVSSNIVEIIEETSRKIKQEKSRIYSKELIEILFSNVYCKISHLVESGIASRNIASKYLKELESIGVLKSEKVGKEIIYINIALYDLLKNQNMH